MGLYITLIFKRLFRQWWDVEQVWWDIWITLFHRWELLQGSLLAGGVAAGPLVASPVRSTLEHMTNNLKLFRSITLKPLHISSSPLGVQLCLGYSLASSLWPLASGLNLVCRLGVSSIPLKIYVDVLMSNSPYPRPQALKIPENICWCFEELLSLPKTPGLPPSYCSLSTHGVPALVGSLAGLVLAGLAQEKTGTMQVW